MTFDEWFTKLFGVGGDPVAYYECEKVWNAALDEALYILMSGEDEFVLGTLEAIEELKCK